MTTRQNDPEKEMSMTDDYLWDGSGTPDAEIQHLEAILCEFRHAEHSLVLPITHNAVALMKPRGVLQSPWLSRCAAAAVILIALSLGIFFSRRASYNAPGIGPSWNVANLEGNSQIGSQSVLANQSTAKLYVGQTLTTNSFSRATLSEDDLGQIQIDPNSRVRLLRTDPNHKRLQLEVGTIHAAIWAPPGQFVVDTPSAVAIDLGCAYMLQVAPDGSGTIRTTLGWVGFHLNGRDSFIPAGATCSTRPKVGPGVPYFEDASESLRDALHKFDQAESSSDAASSALPTILSQARPRDGLTLWHLLSRTGGSERAQVYARFAALVPPPPGVTREGILALDPHMLDLYWNALNLGDISLWRFWEQSSDPHATPPPHQILMKKEALLKKMQ
jgi:FecR-like protein